MREDVTAAATPQPQVVPIIYRTKLQTFVSGYHQSPRLWTDIPPDALGVELETFCQDREKVAKTALDCGLLAERDGSLDISQGLEVIGPPLTLRATRRRDLSPWFRFFANTVGQFQADNRSECGMHVNLNLPASHCTLRGKLQYVFNNMNLSVFAGRSPNSYCHQNPVNSIMPYCGNRHSAINIERSNRVEIRIFRATHVWSTFLARVEFCVAVKEYCAHSLTSNLTYNNLISFFKSRRQLYPNLYQYVLTHC